MYEKLTTTAAHVTDWRSNTKLKMSKQDFDLSREVIKNKMLGSSIEILLRFANTYIYLSLSRGMQPSKTEKVNMQDFTSAW